MAQEVFFKTHMRSIIIFINQQELERVAETYNQFNLRATTHVVFMDSTIPEDSFNASRYNI